MDIKCAVCGEPWDSYGINHGDMAPWEASLFKQGAGCPCCKGNRQVGGDHIEDHLRSVVMNDEDPDSFALLHAPDGKRPEWKRPDDEVLFTCPGCDAKLTRDADMSKDAEPDIALSWSHVPSQHYYASRDWPLDIDELHKVADKAYCPGCVAACDDCGEPIFKSESSATGETLFGDTYDPGASFLDPRNHNDSICVTCLEAIDTCAYCGEVIGDDENTDDNGYCESCVEKKAS